MLVCLGVAASRIVSILAARDRAVFWRGGRAVEGAALEMLFRGDSNEGSNPSLSAIFLIEQCGRWALDLRCKTFKPSVAA